MDSSICVRTVHNTICRVMLELLVVRLMSSCCDHRGCVLLVVGWRRRVECIYFLCTRAHTPVTKKKIALVIRAKFSSSHSNTHHFPHRKEESGTGLNCYFGSLSPSSGCKQPQTNALIPNKESIKWI
jgi:hypothetical protein